MFEAFRGRDIAVVILVALSLYHCLSHHSRIDFALEPVWFAQHTELSELSKQLPAGIPATPRAGILAPVLSDLDDDGFNELIMIDDKQTLRVSSHFPFFSLSRQFLTLSLSKCSC